MEQIIPAASVLITHQDKVLLVRSNTTGEMWAFPGGKQENNETFKQAARREIKEELGIDIEPEIELDTYIFGAGSRKYQIKCFIARANDFDIKVDPVEILEARWCTLEQARNLNLTSSTREALEKYAVLSI